MNKNEIISQYNSIELESKTTAYINSLSRRKVESLRIQMEKIFNISPYIEEDKKYPFSYNYSISALHELKDCDKICEELEKTYGHNVIIPSQFKSVIYPYIIKTANIKEEFLEYMFEQNISKWTIIYNWLIWKQVYKFDENFLNLLINDEGYETIPSSILKNLPYDSFSIENTIQIGDIKIKNILITKTQNELKEDIIILYYVLDTKDNDYFFEAFPLSDDNTILSSFMKHTHPFEKEFIEVVKHTFPLLVYLCSNNKEVRYIEAKNGIEKNRSKYTKKKNISVYDVGYEIGATIKSTKTVYINNKPRTEKGSSSPKKPHTRSGHFHHFWVGKGKSTLIVKYIPPIFVKGGNLKPMIHKVKS